MLRIKAKNYSIHINVLHKETTLLLIRHTSFIFKKKKSQTDDFPTNILNVKV